MNKFIVICALNKLAPTRKIAVPYGRQKIVASIEPKLLLLLLRHPGIECPSFSIHRLAKRSDGDLLELVLFQVLEKKTILLLVCGLFYAALALLLVDSCSSESLSWSILLNDSIIC